MEDCVENQYGVLRGTQVLFLNLALFWNYHWIGMLAFCAFLILFAARLVSLGIIAAFDCVPPFSCVAA